MNTDCKALWRINAGTQTLTPFTRKQTRINGTGKTLALGMALLLGACATTGDKSTEEPAQQASAEQIQPAQAQSSQTQSDQRRAPEKKPEPAASEPAPTAAELMKTLRMPVKEPVIAAPAPTAAPAPVASQPAAVPAAPQDAPVPAVQTVAPVAAVPVTPPPATLPKTATVKPAPKAVAVQQSEPAERQQPAPAGMPEPVPAIDAKAFSVTTKQLPFTYDIWTIRKGNTPLTKGLVIVTPTWEMGKEGYMSQIWLTLMEDKIHINSSSDIETASKGLGIRIDGGELIPFSSVAETNIAVIEGKWLDRLARAEKLDIYLGFFPGKKPTSDTFNSDLSLSNLARIVATYRTLNN